MTLRSDRIEAMLGHGVLCEVVMPLPDDLELCDAEEAQLARAVPRRRREFAAGRHCAKKALGRLGLHNVVLPIGSDRAPMWPTGVVGTISHTDTACLAAVAWKSAVRSVGADIEPDEPLEPELYRLILTGREQTWLKTQPATTRGRLARLIFSAKESFYKLQYPLTGRFLEFQDVEISLRVNSSRFVLSLLSEGEGPAKSATYQGSYLAEASLLVTGMTLRT
jgi:4'-phosphopantetheinyl transferase EntD